MKQGFTSHSTHKIGNLGDVLPSQSVGSVLKIQNRTTCITLDASAAERHLDWFSRFHTARPCVQHTQTTLQATCACRQGPHLCVARAGDGAQKLLGHINMHFQCRLQCLGAASQGAAQPLNSALNRSRFHGK